MAEDGSSALVKFTSSGKDGNYISITSNKKTIKVKQKETTPNGAVYEENSVLVKSEGDKVTIEQDGNVIELKKARGQWFIGERVNFKSEWVNFEIQRFYIHLKYLKTKIRSERSERILWF